MPHDTSSVAYSDSEDYIETIMVDDTCKLIYNDCVKIHSPDIPFKEDAFFTLIEKYNEHYLVYYFLARHYEKYNYKLAEACYKICLSKYPLVDAYLNLAIIYQQLGNEENTKKLLNSAYLSSPNDLRVLNFLGAIYYLEKDFFTAIKHYEEVLKKGYTQKASIKNVYNNIGFACSAIGKCHRALDYFECGLKIECPSTPENIKMNVQLLQNKLINYDYMFDNPPNVFEDFLCINKLMACVNNSKFTNIQHSGKIRIGYISPDLRQHVCACFLEPIFEHYDRTKFSVYCYANVRHEDGVSEKIKHYPEINWFNIFDISASNVSKLIKSHSIDILIDLAGHTNGNRLDVMALKPAPIQMTYLGYPNSTGLTNVDYRITDAYADPITTKQRFSETLIRLPRCFVCYTTNIDFNLIPIVPSRHKSITFGVMNKLNKHNKTTFFVWSEIIKRVPNSVLLIKRDMKSAFDIRVKYLKKLGLKDEQLQVTNFIKDHVEYLNMYNSIDICLDTFPYSGTTTSCDSFLMSTPIVTLGMPDRHVSNVTNSMLQNMGFNDLITHTLDDYIKTAVNLANDQDKIIYYKNNIRKKFMELMDAKKFSSEFDELIEKTFINHK